MNEDMYRKMTIAEVIRIMSTMFCAGIGPEMQILIKNNIKQKLPN